jgi:uncharacterized protein (TIGR02145 family)
MKTLRKTAEEAYLKYANKIINRETWIDGFISGIQYKKEYPQSIELCGLLWDTENLAIGGYEKDGRHYYTWQEAMDAAKSVGKRLPTWQEWEALCDLGSTWDDERKGRWFGGNHNSDHKGSLFLPAAGLRNFNSGDLAYASSYGYFWSSSPYYGGNYNAGYLYFTSGYVYPLNYYFRAYGFSVRCVQNK